MIINQSNLHGLTTGYSAAFNKALSEVSPDYKDIATVTSSSTAANDYAWLGQIPGMKEWIGDREVQHISEYCIAGRVDSRDRAFLHVFPGGHRDIQCGTSQHLVPCSFHSVTSLFPYFFASSALIPRFFRIAIVLVSSFSPSGASFSPISPIGTAGPASSRNFLKPSASFRA